MEKLVENLRKVFAFKANKKVIIAIISLLLVNVVFATVGAFTAPVMVIKLSMIFQIVFDYIVISTLINLGWPKKA